MRLKKSTRLPGTGHFNIGHEKRPRVNPDSGCNWTRISDTPIPIEAKLLWRVPWLLPCLTDLISLVARASRPSEVRFWLIRTGETPMPPIHPNRTYGPIGCPVLISDAP